VKREWGANCYMEVATDVSPAGEGMGESHATNDRTSGPDRSEAGIAKRKRPEQPGETKRTPCLKPRR
jgi:hypothetical protein